MTYADAANDGDDAGAGLQASHRYHLLERLPGDVGRDQLERFVADRFEHTHQARVRSFLPTLVGLEDRHGQLRCALGYRSAAQERLFLEQYLDTPIEHAIESAGAQATAVRREEIVEVGNLAGRGCRAAVYLVSQIPRYLLARGFRWIAFTSTDRVREILQGFHAPVLDLGPADPARLKGGAEDWGRYYEADPRVLAAWLPDGLSFSR